MENKYQPTASPQHLHIKARLDLGLQVTYLKIIIMHLGLNLNKNENVADSKYQKDALPNPQDISSNPWPHKMLHQFQNPSTRRERRREPLPSICWMLKIRNRIYPHKVYDL